MIHFDLPIMVSYIIALFLIHKPISKFQRTFLFTTVARSTVGSPSLVIITRIHFEQHIVKAQVRDLRYNSGNLYPNCIIRHMLMK